jgi:hypothetical protein
MAVRDAIQLPVCATPHPLCKLHGDTVCTVGTAHVPVLSPRNTTLQAPSSSCRKSSAACKPLTISALAVAQAAQHSRRTGTPRCSSNAGTCCGTGTIADLGRQASRHMTTWPQPKIHGAPLHELHCMTSTISEIHGNCHAIVLHLAFLAHTPSGCSWPVRFALALTTAMTRNASTRGYPVPHPGYHWHCSDFMVRRRSRPRQTAGHGAHFRSAAASDTRKPQRHLNKLLKHAYGKNIHRLNAYTSRAK